MHRSSVLMALVLACTSQSGEVDSDADSGGDASMSGPTAESTGAEPTSGSSGSDDDSCAACGTGCEPCNTPSFEDLCAEPGVVFCEGFDVDLSNADFNNREESPDRPHGIAVDNDVFADGGGSLRLTVDGSRSQEVTGTIGYDFPQIDSGTFYVGLQMRFGDGLQTLLRSQGFRPEGSGGMKFFQIVTGPRSCSSEEIVFYDIVAGGWLTGVPGLVYSCDGFPVFGDGGEYQPIDGVETDGCRRTLVQSIRDAGEGMVGWPPCRGFEDDTWHQVELEVQIDSGYRLWIDGSLVIDSRTLPPSGPYGRFYMSNYITGYGGDTMIGSQTFGDGLWRVYYDNLVISRDCITSCGQ